MAKKIFSAIFTVGFFRIYFLKTLKVTLTGL